MNKNPSAVSDDALAQLVFESQLTQRKIETFADAVFERVRKFSAFYEALPEKPAGVALLCQEHGSTSVIAHPIGQKLTVGRLSKSNQHPDGADLTLKDAEMSRTHFEISPTDGLHVLRDLDSRNGTYVNGHRQTGRETILKGGDTILAGNTIFVFTGA